MSVKNLRKKKKEGGGMGGYTFFLKYLSYD